MDRHGCYQPAALQSFGQKVRTHGLGLCDLLSGGCPSALYDVKHVVEELVKLLAQVESSPGNSDKLGEPFCAPATTRGVQGAVHTVNPIKTSPYHPKLMVWLNDSAYLPSAHT